MLEGHDTIKYVRFEETPQPDVISNWLTGVIKHLDDNTNQDKDKK